MKVKKEEAETFFLLPLMNILNLTEIEHHKIINDLQQLMTN